MNKDTRELHPDFEWSTSGYPIRKSVSHATPTKLSVMGLIEDVNRRAVRRLQAQMHHLPYIDPNRARSASGGILSRMSSTRLSVVNNCRVAESTWFCSSPSFRFRRLLPDLFVSYYSCLPIPSFSQLHLERSSGKDHALPRYTRERAGLTAFLRSVCRR